MKLRNSAGLYLVNILGFVLLVGAGVSAAHASDDSEDVKNLASVTQTLLRHNMVFLDNPEITKQLDTVLERLWDAQNGSVEIPRIQVINDSTPNAFSDPSGVIYITTGLLDVLEDRQELAFVLAHEIAHVNVGDYYAAFNSTKNSRMVRVVGGALLATVAIIATVGMAASAMGPMGTATTASTAITSAGANVSSAVLGGAMSSDIGARARMRYVKTDLVMEPQQHPVYAPALFGTVTKALYEGYGAEEELKANEEAHELLQTAGFAVSNGMVSRIQRRLGGGRGNHLTSYVNVGEQGQ